MPFRVLIIGASFGGLTVANRLLLSEKKDTERDGNVNEIQVLVDVVDALRPPSADCVFVGDISVPFAKSVLEELGLSNDEGLSKRKGSCDICRQELLDCLRKRVPVKYHHVVQEVSLKEDKNNSANMVACWAKVQVGGQDRNCKDTISMVHMGPYDAVILATGARSQFQVKFSSNLSVSLLSVGDVRYTRWWDFGQHRIRQGANQALKDGLDLGNSIQALAKRQGQGGHNVAQMMPSKFWVSTQHRAWRLYGILLALFAAIAIQFMKQ